MKLISLTLCTLFFSTFLFSQVDLEAGLVAYYPFSGNAVDESAFDNNATSIFEATLTEGVTGEANEAYFFDGSNDHILVPHAQQINFNNQQAFTVSLWIKVPEEQNDLAGGGSDIISKWQNAGAQPYPFVIRVFNQTSPLNGQVRALTFVGESLACGEQTIYSLNSISTVNDNTWHHIIFTRTDNGVLQLYIDCKLEAETVDNSICTTQNDAPLYIGMRVPNPPFTRAFRGSIDEIRIYNRALNEAEISSFCEMVSDTENALLEKGIRLFPNPVQSGREIQAVIKGELSIQSLTIFNANGKRLGQYEVDQALNLPPGFYTVLIKSMDNQYLTEKLIVIE